MAEDEKREVVTVVCGIPNGVQLRLCREHDGAMVPYGEPVILQGPKPSERAAVMTTEPVLNPGIDREFFDKWLEQNARSPLVVDGHIRLNDEKKAPAE